MFHIKKLTRDVSPLALVILGVFSTTIDSSAQNASPDATAKPPERMQPTAGDGAQLEEITVTAQKRLENLQEVPVSVQVISSHVLEQQNFNTLSDLTQTVPAVHIGNSGGNAGNDLYIRGIGSGQNQSFDQSVATFVDDIYHGRSLESGATFLDLDHIEVLKGPQSTFFGNSAIAGALNIVTKKPGDTYDGWARALYGMYGQYATEGAVTLPISDKFSIRAAGTFNGGSGWIKNVNTGKDAPDVDNKAGRLTMLYKPTDDLDATFKIEGSRNKTTGTAGDQPQQRVDCPPPPPFTLTYANFGTCPQALALGIPIGLNSNENAGLAGQYFSLSTFEDVLTINYHQWGQMFTSVTGYSSYHANQNVDDVQLPVPVVTNQEPEHYHQLSQELRVASPSNQAIEYLAGAYFQTSGLTHEHEVNLPGFNFLATIPGFTALAPYVPLAAAEGFSQDAKVYAVFGSVSWNITDSLKVTGGFRGSWETKDTTGTSHFGTGTQIYGGFVPLPPALDPLPGPLFGVGVGTQNYHQTFDDWTPSARLQYQITPQAMAYFSYNKGFKAGGVNAELGAIGPPQNFVYGPEHVNAYELGLKSKWFSDTVLLNLDVFRSNYTGLQVNTLIYAPLAMAYIGQVANAAASRSQGVELEAQWAISRDLRLSANVTYLDSTYVNFPNAPPGTLQGFCATDYVLPGCSVYPNPVPPIANLAGQRTQYAPLWSGSVTASYSMLLPREYKFTTELSPYFTSSYYGASASGNDPFFRVDSYVRLDARLSLETPAGHWAVDLIGKNLADRIIPAPIILGLASKEEPRNVAVQFRYRY